MVGGEEEDLPSVEAKAKLEEDLNLKNVADPQLDRACDMLRGILVFEAR